MQENTAQNLGYAGFFFKKTLQPHSLRNEHLKQPNDFKDRNLVLYVNHKFKEIRKRIGTDVIPKDVFLQSILQTKSSKTDINKLLLQATLEDKHEKQRLNDEVPVPRRPFPDSAFDPGNSAIIRNILRSINDKKSREVFVYESGGAAPKRCGKRPDSSNPEQKVKALLHEKLGESELKEGLSQFNKLRLKTKFQQLKRDRNFEKIDFNKKFKVINQMIHNEDDPLENLYFMTEVCQRNNIDLSHLLSLDPQKLDLLDPGRTSPVLTEASEKASPEEKRKKTIVSRFHRRLSSTEIEAVIQKEEDEQTGNLIRIFKKTQEEQDEYRQKLTSKEVSKRQNFQDQLFSEMDNRHRHEILKILRKKNEFNQQKFIRANREFDPNKKLDQMLYYDRLAAPKHRNPHSRVLTSPNIPSPQTTPTLKPTQTLTLTSPQNRPEPKVVATPATFTLGTTANSNSLTTPKPFRTRFQSVAAVQLTSSQKSPLEITDRPQTTKHAGQRQSFNFRPQSPVSTVQDSSDPKSRKDPKQRFSMVGPPSMALGEGGKIEEEKSPRSPSRARVSIFETYKEPKLMTSSMVFEKDKMERKFKAVLHRKREKSRLIGSFDRFFVKCDLEAVVQTDETKQINDQLRKFGEDYRRMQGQAGKTVERLDLHSSDAKFNQMREKVRFKKKLIEHLMGRIIDKQDLLSMYNKQVSMEDNVNKSRMVLKESK